MRDENARAAIRQLMWALEDLHGISQLMRWDAVVAPIDQGIVDHALARSSDALRAAAALIDAPPEVPA